MTIVSIAVGAHEMTLSAIFLAGYEFLLITTVLC